MHILTEQYCSGVQHRESVYVGKVRFCEQVCSNKCDDADFAVGHFSMSGLQQKYMQFYQSISNCSVLEV